MAEPKFKGRLMPKSIPKFDKTPEPSVAAELKGKIDRCKRELLQFEEQYANLHPLEIAPEDDPTTKSRTDLEETAAVPLPAVTHTIQVFNLDLPQTVKVCQPVKKATIFHKSFRDHFSVGDIGWYPVLRPSVHPCRYDILTQYGYVCAKGYPIIIVNKLKDCMIGLIISTAMGDGLANKLWSTKARSTHVIGEFVSDNKLPSCGEFLVPQKSLRVRNPVGSFRYTPADGSYVDFLNTIQIPYDSRFEKSGSLTKGSIKDLIQMRASATLRLGKSSWLRETIINGHEDFKKWLNECRQKLNI